MTPPLTRDLGAFVAGLSFDALPNEALAIARTGFIDCIGTMIAGRNEPAPQLLKATLAPGPGPATLYFSDESAAAPEAALINGTAGHALDFDDVAFTAHPSTVLVPAILAEAEALGRSGADMLAAYVAGYEVWAELALRIEASLHAKGWHPTGVWGAVAAAAACAHLHKLDAGRTATAIALGASQSAGLMANFGSMAKPFHAGRAAQAGVLAARLAAQGFTASLDALEHPQGLLSAVSPKPGDADMKRSCEAGTGWRIVEHGLNIKKYPTCYCTHRSLDAMLDLKRATGFSAADVTRIRVHISDRYATILRNHAPQTGLAAKFSMEFAMACAAIAGRAGLAELSDDFVQRADVQNLMERVELELTQDYAFLHPERPVFDGDASVFDQVHVHLASGEVLASAEVRFARGHAHAPLADGELFEKFTGCLAYGGMDGAEDLFARLMAMETLPARHLTAPPAAEQTRRLA